MRTISRRTSSKTKSINSCFSQKSKKISRKSQKLPLNLEEENLDFRNKLLRIEAAFAEKQRVLQNLFEEIRSFFESCDFQDTLFLEEYEAFLQKSLALLKVFWKTQWKIEEIEGFLAEIPRFPANKLAIRLENMVFRTKELENTIKSCDSSQKKLEIFAEVLNSAGFRYLYTEVFQEIIDFYGKYKLFCKKLEIFCVLDSRISLNSFIILEKHAVYDSLFEYLVDLFDFSELPVVKKPGKREFLQLFQQQSLETLEELVRESELFLQEGQIREKLAEKLRFSQSLSTALAEIFERKPKEITNKYTIVELHALFSQNNVFLPIFWRFHAKKLENSASAQEILQKSLKEKSKSLEEIQKNQVLLLSNYEREASQEVCELLFVEKLSAETLKKLVFHYEVFEKLGLSLKNAKVFAILRDFARFYEFLQKLQEITEFTAPQNLERWLERFSQEVLENLFLRTNCRREIAVLQELVGKFASFSYLRDEKLAKILASWRCFYWLWETEAAMSRTKGLTPAEIAVLSENLQEILRTFAEYRTFEVEKLLSSHYIYAKFERFYEEFERFMRIYAETVMKPLISEERIPEEKLAETREKVQFLVKSYKSLNLQFELAKKRLEDFEILCIGSTICKTFCDNLSGKSLVQRSYDIEKLRVIHEFEKNCALTRIFPFFEKIRETHNYYQNISQEIIEIKRTFNEKKLAFTKYIILQLHSKDYNIIMTENVAFSREIYENYQKKIRSSAQIEEMLEVLKKIRFNIKNYKDLLRQSFEMTGIFSSSVQKLTRERSLCSVSFENALDFLSSLVYFRNDLIRKPLFFCREVLEFAAFEWSFCAKSLVEGWVSYFPQSDLLSFLLRATRNFQGNLKENPPFLVNELSLWEKILQDGEFFQEKFEEFDCFQEELIPAMRSRLAKVQEIREKVRRIKNIKAFLLENIEDFFKQSSENGVFSAKCREFRDKRKALLVNVPHVRDILQELEETRVFLKEDTDFLLDLRKKLDEIEKSVKILKKNLRKHFETGSMRAIPHDFALNLYKTLYSSPFLSESQEIIDLLATLAGFFAKKLSFLESDKQETVQLLELYEKNPLFLASVEPFLADFSEFEFLKKQIIEEMRENFEEKSRKLISEETGDLFEIVDFDDSSLSFSWEDVLKLEEKLRKRGFFSNCQGFDAISLELVCRKSRILEEISFNKRPKTFFTVNRRDLKQILARMRELFSRNPEDLARKYRENEAFLEKFVRKVDLELARVARNVLQDAGIRAKIKESAQFFAKCVDISKEILEICSFSEPELANFIRKIEAGEQEPAENQLNSKVCEESLEKCEKNGEKTAKVLENKQVSKVSKTFQSIFRREPATIVSNKAKVKAKPKKDAVIFEETPENIEEPHEKAAENEQLREEILSKFKSREENVDFSAIERERARSVQLLSKLLRENAYVAEEFNTEWACSRLETQIFKKYNEINEKYRADMIELIDLLEALKRNPSFSAQVLSEQKKLCLEMILEIKSEILGACEKSNNAENIKKNTADFQENVEVSADLIDNDDFNSIMQRLKDVCTKESEVFFIEDDANDE